MVSTPSSFSPSAISWLPSTCAIFLSLPFTFLEIQRKVTPGRRTLASPSLLPSWGSPSRLRSHLHATQQPTRQSAWAKLIPKRHHIMYRGAAPPDRILDELLIAPREIGCVHFASCHY